MRGTIKRRLARWPAVLRTVRAVYRVTTYPFTQRPYLERLWRRRRAWSVVRQATQLLDQSHLLEIAILPSGVVLTSADGFRFHFDPADGQGLLGLELDGTYEGKETALLQAVIQPGWTILDVGANFGWYTAHFSKWVGPKGVVHAFEPHPSMMATRQRNLTLNNLNSNITLNQSALSSSHGTATLSVPRKGGPAFARLSSSESAIRVDVTTVDDYARRSGLSRVDLIKVDVEGAELGVLHGARETLERHKPHLMLEVQVERLGEFGNTPDQLLAFLESIGYRAYRIRPGAAVAAVFDIDDGEDYNFLFSANGAPVSERADGI